VQAQGLPTEALSSFPADTQQIAYTDLSALRDMPNYPQIRLSLFNRQMQTLEDFLGTIGNDPEKDATEVVLGWRSNSLDATAMFGMAGGSFDPIRGQAMFDKSQLPSLHYRGFTLDTYDSSADRDALYFTFLSSGLAAFGRLEDLKALIDVRLGDRPPLDSNAQFENWEAELEGSAPEWGITTGKAAQKLVTPWFAGTGTSAGGNTSAAAGAGSKQAKPMDIASLLAPVEAILYHVDWNGDFTADISVICQKPDQAAAIAQLITILQNSHLAATLGASPQMAAFVQGLEVDLEGNRVELDGSGPPNLVNQVLNASPSP
jgi:hypothetical protein